MKIVTIIISLVIVLSSAVVSAKSSPVDVEGIWKGKINGGPGRAPMSVTFNFKKEGGDVKGTITDMSGKLKPLEDLEIKGKKISFTVTSKMGQKEMKIKYKGKVKGEKIKLNFKTEIPGAKRKKGARMDIGMSGSGGGSYGGGAGFMGTQANMNELIVERVPE